MPRLLTWQEEAGKQQGDACQMQSFALCFRLQVIFKQGDTYKNTGISVEDVSQFGVTDSML